MRRVFTILLCSLFLNAGTATAQPTFLDTLTPPLPVGPAQTVARTASWGTAITAVAFDTKASWESPDRKRAFLVQGGRLTLTYVLVFTAKKLVGRQRPCAPNDCGMDNPGFSFYSAHSAVPMVSGQPVLAALTAAGRVLGGNHYLTDVLVGLAQGWVVRKLVR